MDLQRIGVLVPCEEISDFPTYYRAADAASLLAGWTAAWRPGLIAATGRLPEIISSYAPPAAEDWANGLVIVPLPGDTGEAIEWLDTVRAAQPESGLVIEGFEDRQAIISAMQQGAAPLALSIKLDVANAIEAEFFALAYAYLQVAKLTGEMRYGSVYDPTVFQAAVVDAARSAIAADEAAVQAALTRAYDHLEQTRNHSYPVSIHLLDVLLIAPTTLGASLAKELSAAETSHPVNVLLTGSLVDQMAKESAESLTALRGAIEAGRASIVTSGYAGTDLSLLPPEAMLDELRCGVAAIEGRLGAAPRVFGQYTSSLPPRLPQLLKGLDFVGGLLVGFDGGDPVMSDHGRSTWVGIDGSALESAVAMPRDLGRSETVLGLSAYLQETLERDHTATVLLAGWPGSRHDACQDLLNVARRSDVLGRFVTLEEYFERSSPADHWGHIHSDDLGPTPVRLVPSLDDHLQAEVQQSRLTTGLGQLAAAISQVEPKPTGDDPLRSAKQCFLSALGARESLEAGSATLAINPWSFACPASAGEAAAAHGYKIESPNQVNSGPDRAEDSVLRNEQLEATIHTETGGLQSLRSHSTRRNQLSQRLDLVRRRGRASIASMRAEAVEVVANSDTLGAIQCRGLLVDPRGETLMGFEQTFQLPAGADWLLMDVKLEPARDATNLLADCDCLCRMKVAEGDWHWRRGLQWAGLSVDRSSFVASEYVQLVDAESSITVGLDVPRVVRRSGDRQLDVALPLGDRTIVDHRFAVSLNSRWPLRTAFGGLAGVVKIPLDSASVASAPPAGWWLHVDAANVLVSQLEVDPKDPRQFRVHLIETEGRAAGLKLRCCRQLVSARRESLRGESSIELPIVDGVAELEIGAYGWQQVAATW